MNGGTKKWVADIQSGGRPKSDEPADPCAGRGPAPSTSSHIRSTLRLNQLTTVTLCSMVDPPAEGGEFVGEDEDGQGWGKAHCNDFL